MFQVTLIHKEMKRVSSSKSVDESGKFFYFLLTLLPTVSVSLRKSMETSYFFLSLKSFSSIFFLHLPLLLILLFFFCFFIFFLFPLFLLLLHLFYFAFFTSSSPPLPRLPPPALHVPNGILKFNFANWQNIFMPHVRIVNIFHRKDFHVVGIGEASRELPPSIRFCIETATLNTCWVKW